jgi:transcriptional regulator with XRE-family HTH domain
MAELYRRIGEKIRELRLRPENGAMSQEALGEKLGVASNTVSRWETGTYKPTAEDLDKLARLFGVPIRVFFPDLRSEDEAIAILTSATAGLTKDDLDEVIRYAEFRKARRTLEATKRARPKKS